MTAMKWEPGPIVEAALKASHDAIHYEGGLVDTTRWWAVQLAALFRCPLVPRAG